jgi:hypothetical protein
MFELLPGSDLEYTTKPQRNVAVFTTADMGSGPPHAAFGWVRTGFVSNGSQGVGEGNCNAYSSSLITDDGTTVALAQSWEATGLEFGGPWFALRTGCSGTKRVWCIED